MATRQTEIADVLRSRVLTGLHFGTLRPGTRLPSVRTLQAELDADPRVVLAAYRRLEGEGLVEVRQRSGIFVAASGVSPGNILPQTAGWIVQVLAEGLGRGIPAVALPDRLRGALATVRLRAACVECNDDQIIGLCTELERDFGLEVSGVELESLRAETLPERAAQADLWVTTSFHAADVQPLADQFGKPLILVSLRTDFLSEIKRMLLQGPVFWVVSDPRFAAKLPRILGSAPQGENLRVVIAGQDDLEQLPRSAPVYVMQAARASVDIAQIPGTLMPSMRVFSLESARQILAFIIERNIAAGTANLPESSRGAPEPIGV